jgi:hypothetical protein
MCKRLWARTLLAGLGLIFNGTIPAEENDKAAVISKMGDHELFDGKLAVKVYEDKGKLTLDVAHRLKNKSFFTHSMPQALAKEGSFWLIYAETPNKVWYFLYPSSVPLVRWEITETERGVSDSTAAFGPGDALKNAPKVLRNALPQAVIDKLNRN